MRFGQLVVRDWPPISGWYVTDCDCGVGVELVTREELVEGTVDRCEYCQDADDNGGNSGG
ncbi:hypothetical protein [Kineobactrum sediminis]|uniref:hypothetical protein n=1 Tax=Kineobactrum sediminis TaxID=1905677 RepID=UPI0011AED2D2|nr:hypothetical protein [Kineobactrum sediminis]